MYHAGRRTHRCSRRRRRSGSAAQHRAHTPPPLETSAVARERFGDSTPLDAGDAAAPAAATVVTAEARVFVRRIENGATPRSSSAESTSRSFRRSWPRRDVPRCRRCQPRARRGEPPSAQRVAEDVLMCGVAPWAQLTPSQAGGQSEAVGQCEKHPLCRRGFKHQGKGGHCSLRMPDGSGAETKRQSVASQQPAAAAEGGKQGSIPEDEDDEFARAEAEAAALDESIALGAES